MGYGKCSVCGEQVKLHYQDCHRREVMVVSNHYGKNIGKTCAGSNQPPMTEVSDKKVAHQ